MINKEYAATLSEKLKHLVRFSFLLGLLLSLAACSGTPSIVDYDTTRSFSNLDSYRWASAQETVASNQQSNTQADKTQSIIEDDTSIPHQDLLSKRIKRTLDTRLTQKGMRLDIVEPDVLVSYQLTTQSNIYRDTYYYSPYDIYLGGCSRYSHFCGGGTIRGDTRDYQYTELFLVLRFLNPQDNEVIWQGVIELPKNTSRKSATQYDQEIDIAVTELISQFPPASAAKSTK